MTPEWSFVAGVAVGLFWAYGVVRFWIWWAARTRTDEQNYSSPSIRDNVKRTR
jgi:hypothetical protein